MNRIYIIDDDTALCRSLSILLLKQDIEVKYSSEPNTALNEIVKFCPSIILLDLKLPGADGIDILKKLRQDHPDLPVIIITGQQDMKSAISAMREGAYDFIRKPFDIAEIIECLEKVNRIKKLSSLSSPQNIYTEDDEIVGKSPEIISVLKDIGLLSKSRVTVLIHGESGTGKELVAKALHNATSPEAPYVAVNCSAFVSTLLESELFGHVKGAFTGAVADHKGKLAYAGNGTLFLDEIGDMPLELQSKLLRVLQENEFYPVGSLQPVQFYARVIAATNRNLREMIQKGLFREDLYFRIAVSELNLPPLNKRIDDIPDLCSHLVQKICKKLHRPVCSIESSALEKLQKYHWPGNIRELENVITRAIVSAQSNIIAKDMILSDITESSSTLPQQIGPLWQAEKTHIAAALEKNNWNITQTAKILEISPTTLRKKISDYSIKKSS